MPSPIRYHKLFEKGEIPESWLKHVRDLMVIAEKTVELRVEMFGSKPRAPIRERSQKSRAILWVINRDAAAVDRS